MTKTTELKKELVEDVLSECSDRSLFDINSFDEDIQKEIRGMLTTALTKMEETVREEANRHFAEMWMEKFGYQVILWNRNPESHIVLNDFFLSNSPTPELNT